MLSPPHDISGLVAWARRDEWRAALADLLHRHSAKACADAGVAMEQIADVLGKHFGSALWGSAFEDLLATDLPDGRNIADEYLRRYGWKESVSTREYIAGLRLSLISLYEVSGVVPGESMLLRDLVRGGEPVRVMEKSGTSSLQQWDRIATRVIPLRHRTVISGTPMAFDRETSDALVETLVRMHEQAPRDVAAVADELGVAADSPDLAGLPSQDLRFAQAAFMVTNLWLYTAFKAAKQPEFPLLVNSEGDQLAFTILHFPLLPEATVARVRAAIANLPEFRWENADFWNWLAEPGAPTHTGPRQSNARILLTTMNDGSFVLGTLVLKGCRLSLESNSPARAARGRTLLEPVLAGLVGPPLTEHADLGKMLAADRPAPEPSGLSPDEERAVVHQMLDGHYRRVMDEPISALGGKSPRAAVKTARGRVQVAAWLKTLENHMVREGPVSQMGSYDVGWMWAELGVTALRR